MSVAHEIQVLVVSLSSFYVLSICAVPTFAQAWAGTLTGSVVDSTGAVVGDVFVTATNMDRNTVQRTRTNEAGTYVIPAVNPGRYSITAERAGFRKVVHGDIKLQVNQTLRIDVRLEIGSVAEAIRVTDDAPILDTENSARGTVIDGQKILNLPLNGRDYNQLALLSPGVLPATPRLAGVNFKGAINVNGNRVFNNVFLLDGVDNGSYSSSYRGENAQVIQPSVEALQEFKIHTNAYSAQFGRSSGAVVNAAIRSGTNDIRGSIYEFLRNDALDANNFFSNAFGAPKPARKRNQFGLAVGGPILMGRTFWFADFEGVVEREGVPQTRVVPSPAEKVGLFSTPVVDPFVRSRPEFGQNAMGQWVIPQARWDAVAARIIPLIPDPNVGGTNLYASTPTTRARSRQFDIRIDHNPWSNTQFFARYSFTDASIFRPAPLPGLAEGSYNDAFGSNSNRAQGLALAITRVLAPPLVGDFRLGWTKGDYSTRPPNAGIDGAAQVGLKNVPSQPTIIGGLPKIGFQGFDAIGRHTSTPQSQTPHSWNPRSAFSFQHGKHFLRFGFEYLSLQTEINDLNATIGAMAFVNRFTGRALGDFLLGLPSQLALTSFTLIDQRQKMNFSFLQDDFKFSPSLTLNLGFRYEYSTPPLEKDNRLANFDPQTGTVRFAEDGSIFDRALVHPDRNNWAPRAGFSYSPADRWVIRGAYGIFYSHTVRQGREGLLGFNPPFLADNAISTNVLGPAAVASAALFRLSDGYPQGLLSPNSLATSLSRRGQDPNQRTSYVQQFNLGIQRQLRPDLLLDVAYVGNKGTKLPGFRNVNTPSVIVNPNGSNSAGPRPYPGLGDIQWVENRGNSTYHALQLQADKHFESGLSAMASYTWAKALGDAPDHLSTAAVGAGLDTGVYRVPQNSSNLRGEHGLSEFDVAHRVVVSYVYELPWGQGRRWGQSWNGVTDFLCGGWQISGIHTLQGGLPLTAILGGSSVLNIGGERIVRPNLVADPNLPPAQRTVERWFNTEAFVPLSPAPQAFGTAGTGVMRGPGLANFDFSLAKKINLSESHFFQFRTEIFNAFNHPAFGPPDIRLDSTTFGRIVSAAHARIIQFGLKLYY
jgi:hypothetical protein